jgi:hypothetical protein
LKIAVVGTFASGQLATVLARGMRSASQDVAEISDAQEVPPNKVARFAAERWSLASTAIAIALGGQEPLIHKVAMARPDLVLVVKSPYLTTRTVDEIRKQCQAPVVNWMPDDPFLALRPAMKLSTLVAYDHVVTYSDSICRRLMSELSLSASVIPFGFDPIDYQPDSDRIAEWDVTFVGQHSAHREQTLREIAHAGITLRVFGPNWQIAQSVVRNCWDPTPVFGPDACHRYHLGRVGVNILHPQNNVGSHNMRTFEIPAAGRKMLTTETAQQRHLLKGISGIEFYLTGKDLVRQLKSMIGRAVLPEEALMREHTYEQRCLQLLSTIAR